MRDLNIALGWLVGLSLATTALANLPIDGTIWVVVVFLVLSGWKARIILTSYLGLGPSRFWRRFFMSFVTGFLILATGIYLLPLAQ